MSELLVTNEMLLNIKSDEDFFHAINSSHIKCDDIAVYDKLMDILCQFNISVYGNRVDLVIVI